VVLQDLQNNTLNFRVISVRDLNSRVRRLSLCIVIRQSFLTVLCHPMDDAKNGQVGSRGLVNSKRFRGYRKIIKA
jgi:hypothetical protein